MEIIFQGSWKYVVFILKSAIVGGAFWIVGLCK